MRPSPRLSAVFLPLLAVSCQVKPYAPPPQLAHVESITVEVGDFEGRPEVFAHVKGRLSSAAAQLVDARQSRLERTLVLEVLEQTPRGVIPLADPTLAPPFETRIPVEILGLEPGPCILQANGHLVSFEIPVPRASLAGTTALASYVPPVTLVDEFIPLEELVPLSSPGPSAIPVP